MNIKEAYIEGGNQAFEYAKSINKKDLSTFTADEWVTFCECLCKGYDSKLLDITKNKDENNFIFG